eukprot:TRINITY_DN11609_c0_g2_i2.p1 TRINITY_DN11609_c0_g2~~TRINITY_DN11609_c0_g2_i2.p1  ORF type:complete len:1386 (-),score=255.37 TRINITY_DN11609_c0_g2_i2:190-4347(-)
MLTGVRAGPICTELKLSWDEVLVDAEASGAASEESASLEVVRPSMHWIILTQGGFLLLDVVVLPATLLVLLTGYRCRVFHGGGAASEGRAGDDEHSAEAGYTWPGYHLEVLEDAAVVCHDFLLLPLPMAALCLSVYRLRAALCPESSAIHWRKRGWLQARELFVDLPFVLIGGLALCVLWRADVLVRELRESPDAWARRHAAWRQCVLTGRDMLVFLTMIPIILVTLVRIPFTITGVAALCSKKPRQTAPAMQVCTFGISFPDRGVLDLEGDVPRRLAAPVRAVRVHLLGEEFWGQVRSVWGGVLADVGKALMPVELADEVHLDLNEVNRTFGPSEGGPEAGGSEGGRALRVTMGRNGMLLAGEKSMTKRYAIQALTMRLPCTVWLQLDATTTEGEDLVLCRVPVALQTVKDAWQTTAWQTTHEASETLDPAAQLLPCPDQVSGVRDGAWIVVARECANALLALAHLLLFFLLVCVAPWRAVLAAIRVFEHPEARYLRMLGRADSALDVFMQGVEELRFEATKKMNETVKRCISAQHESDISQKLLHVLRPIKGQLLFSSLSATRRLTGAAVRAAGEDVRCQNDPTVGLMNHMAGFGESARVGFLVSQAIAQTQTTRGLMSGDDLSYVNEELMNADEVAEGHLKGCRRELDELLRVRTENTPRGCSCGAWRLGNVQLVVRESALGALMDYGSMLLVLLLFVTVYRVPSLGSQIYNSWGRITRVWLFWVLQREVLRFAQDCWLVIKILGYSLIVLVTVVRAPDLIVDLAANCTSLKGLHRAALRNLQLVGTHLWELFSLLTAWKTYRLLLKATIFTALLPAAGIHGVVSALFCQGRSPSSDEDGAATQDAPRWKGLRVGLSIFIWLGLVWYSTFCQVGWLPAGEWLAGLLGALAVLLSLHVGLTLVNTSTYRLGDQEWNPDDARVGMTNLLLLLVIYMDGLVLVAVAGGARDVLRHEACVWSATALVGCMMIQASLPWVSASDTRKHIRSSAGFAVCDVLLKAWLLPLFAVLVVQLYDGAGVGNASAVLPVWLTSVLVLCLVAIAVLGAEAQPAEIQSEHKIDIRYPVAFSCVLRTLQLLATALALSSNETIQQTGFLVATCMLLGAELGCPSCSVAFVWPLRISCAAAVALFAGFEAASQPLATGNSALAIAALLLVGVVAAVLLQISEARKRQEQLAASGLPQALLALEGLRGRVVVTHHSSQQMQELPRLDAVSSRQHLAAKLLEFERAVLAHRMSHEFLLQRQQWICSVQDPQASYQALAELASQLHEEVQDPRLFSELMHTLRAWSPVRAQGDRVPYHVRGLILEQVLDLHTLRPATKLLCVVPRPARNLPSLVNFQWAQSQRFLDSLAQKPEAGDVLAAWSCSGEELPARSEVRAGQDWV